MTLIIPLMTPLAGRDIEQKIFASINRAFGLHCHKHSNGRWNLLSRHGFGAIDRHATVGLRRRDMIHPHFNAQFAIVQIMLNQLCAQPEWYHRNATGGWPQPTRPSPPPSPKPSSSGLPSVPSIMAKAFLTTGSAISAL